MRGRTALVTGGSRGIGRAVVLELAKRGARVRFAYRTSDEAAAEVAEIAREAGGEASGTRVDVTRRDDLRRWVQGVMEETGRIDILVNNAGIRRDGLLALMKDADFSDVIEANLVAPFRASREVSRTMIAARYGRIVNVASISALSGPPGQSNYAASKGGLIAMTRSLAKELARFDITVNAVAPGLVETDMVSDLSEAARGEILARVPMERQGRPEEIAAVIGFLASDEASYVTGQVWAVDGGATS